MHSFFLQLLNIVLKLVNLAHIPKQLSINFLNLLDSNHDLIKCTLPYPHRRDWNIFLNSIKLYSSSTFIFLNFINPLSHLVHLHIKLFLINFIFFKFLQCTLYIHYPILQLNTLIWVKRWEYLLRVRCGSIYIWTTGLLLVFRIHLTKFSC